MKTENDVKRNLIKSMLWSMVIILSISYSFVFIVGEFTKPDAVKIIETVKELGITKEDAETAKIIAEASKTQAEAEQVNMETKNLGVFSCLIQVTIIMILFIVTVVLSTLYKTFRGDYDN